jgi:serine/threonine-protein kinase
LALEVAQVLGGLLTVHVERSQGAMVGDAVAVDLYMQARHQYTCMTAEASIRSVALFEQALRRLPEDPLLLAGYAMALTRLWFFDGERAAERATVAAERAVRAAPERGESYLAQATVHVNANRMVEAAIALRCALARAERSAEAHELYGHLLGETGPVEAAVRHLNYAMMLDKSVPRVRFSNSRLLAMDGQLEAALANLSWEGSATGFDAIRWGAIARLLCWHRDGQRARAYLSDPALALPALQLPRQWLEFIAGARWLSPEEFVPLPLHSQSLSPRGRLFGLQLLVEYRCFLGQFDQALLVLRQACDLLLVDLLWLDRCPLLAPLRNEPDFAALRPPVAELARRVQRALGVPPE